MIDCIKNQCSRYLWIDDLYLTGLVRIAIGGNMKNLEANFVKTGLPVRQRLTK